MRSATATVADCAASIPNHRRARLFVRTPCYDPSNQGGQISWVQVSVRPPRISSVSNTDLSGCGGAGDPATASVPSVDAGRQKSEVRSVDMFAAALPEPDFTQLRPIWAKPRPDSWASGPDRAPQALLGWPVQCAAFPGPAAQRLGQEIGLGMERRLEANSGMSGVGSPGIRAGDLCRLSFSRLPSCLRASTDLVAHSAVRRVVCRVLRSDLNDHLLRPLLRPANARWRCDIGAGLGVESRVLVNKSSPAGPTLDMPSSLRPPT